jgi:hypothetical protein
VFQVGGRTVRTLFFLAHAFGETRASEEQRGIVWLPEDKAAATLAHTEARAMVAAAAQVLRSRPPAA